MCQDSSIILYFKYSIITEIAVLPSRKMYVVYIVGIFDPPNFED